MNLISKIYFIILYDIVKLICMKEIGFELNIEDVPYHRDQNPHLH